MVQSYSSKNPNIPTRNWLYFGFNSGSLNITAKQIEQGVTMQMTEQANEPISTMHAIGHTAEWFAKFP